MKTASFRILTAVLALILFLVVALAFRSTEWRPVHRDEGAAVADPAGERVHAGREPRLGGLLRSIDGAIERRDLVAAKVAWRMAYREALTSPRPDALVDVADAAVRFGDVANTRRGAADTARALYLEALSRAQQARSVDTILRVAERLAALDDRALAARASRLAEQVAAGAGAPDAAVSVTAFRDDWLAGAEYER